MVSSEEILGERERKDVGVDGMLEEEKENEDEDEGKGSLYWVVATTWREGLEVLVRRGIDVEVVFK